MEINKERIFLLRNGGELIETQERILFSRSSPGAVPLLTEGSVEIDDVLDTLAWREAQVESLRAERGYILDERERLQASLEKRAKANAALREGLRKLPGEILSIDRFADVEELTFPLLNPTEEEQNEWFETFCARLKEHVDGVFEDFLAQYDTAPKEDNTKCL